MSESTAQPNKLIVIGAGVAGLATAIRLRLKGYAVEVFEANDGPGGKLTQFHLQGYRFDAGPSLFTLPELVTELFTLAGRRPEAYFQYEALSLVCRYCYEDGTRIDAWRDPGAFAREVEAQTGEPAAHVHKVLRHGAELYDITSHVFLERSLHKLSTYLRPATLKSMLQLHKLNAFRSMDAANRRFFDDPRVVQLFNRFATYNGSDPYQAPATLNIIPHLEHNLGAFFPRKGMYGITESLFTLARELGVNFHFGQMVEAIVVEGKQVKGVKVHGQFHAAGHVISNMDIVPTYRKLLPQEPAPERILAQPRSSSALIFYWGMDRQYGKLDMHNIFFSADYRREFDHIWQQKNLAVDPTVYLYVSAKHNPEDAPEGGENWFVMINVPHDDGQDWDVLIPQARQAILQKLERMLGEAVAPHIVCEDYLDPRRIQARTSSWLGALYGNSSNNMFAAFLRHPNFSSRLRGLYFCGGSVHPGGGVPLCLLSAKIVGDLIPAVEA